MRGRLGRQPKEICGNGEMLVRGTLPHAVGYGRSRALRGLSAVAAVPRANAAVRRVRLLSRRGFLSAQPGQTAVANRVGVQAQDSGKGLGQYPMVASETSTSPPNATSSTTTPACASPSAAAGTTGVWTCLAAIRRAVCNSTLREIIQTPSGSSPKTSPTMREGSATSPRTKPGTISALVVPGDNSSTFSTRLTQASSKKKHSVSNH